MNLWMDETLLEKIRSVRLLMLDVDGVLTDGRIIINDQGFESKNFDVKDGHGLKMLMRYGIGVALITGRRSSVVEHRARDLGIQAVYQGVWNKVEIFDEILNALLKVRMNILHKPTRSIITLYQPAACGFFKNIEYLFPVPETVKKAG